MPNGTFPGRNQYPPNPQITSFFQGVNVKAKADSQFHSGSRFKKTNAFHWMLFRICF
jgi:hypothetical protein